MGEDRVMAEVKAPEARPKAKGASAPTARSSLARKIIIFNFLALMALVVGVLALTPLRAGFMAQKEASLAEQAALIAPNMVSVEALDALALPPTLGVSLFNAEGAMIAQRQAPPGQIDKPFTPISDFLQLLWSIGAGLWGAAPEGPAIAAVPAIEAALRGESLNLSSLDSQGVSHFFAAVPLKDGALLLTTKDAALDQHIRLIHERILQIFLAAALLAVVVSLILATTISAPLEDLAAAADITREGDTAAARINLPDLADRPDEIGRLSVALRGMVTALYDRIDSNEQFAADVSHEIKNPLASLRSAVGSLRMVKKEEHRERLLEVIEHDVRRMDRLVSDIANASRLDSELVKEQEEEFNLLQTLKNLADFLGQQAQEKGVDFLTDLPSGQIVIHGLEARLAQVFVNLITNAISFCEKGDAVRIWVRRRDARVLVVVEDTGPGIPEEALSNVFKRFYSDRPASHFGNNSGLGLSISKQIIEAHGGVIWAENIRLAGAAADSAPLGARFVVGLPL